MTPGADLGYGEAKLLASRLNARMVAVDAWLETRTSVGTTFTRPGLVARAAEGTLAVWYADQTVREEVRPRLGFCMPTAPVLKLMEEIAGKAKPAIN